MIYESGFYSEFAGGRWTSVNSNTVKSIILSRVSDDFSAYGITVSETSGDIDVYIGRTGTGYGVTTTGIGSDYYNTSPYAEIFSSNFASESTWQGANATEARIAEALAGTIAHEVGHIFNLYHAFMWDAYDPYYYDAKNSQYFPENPDDLSPGTVDYFDSRSGPVHTHLMASTSRRYANRYVTPEQRATVNRSFSDYSQKCLTFGINGGGSISGTVGNQNDSFNLIWGLENLSGTKLPFVVSTNINLASGNKLYLPQYTTMKMNPSVKLDIFGTIDVNRDVTLTRNGSSGLWGYFDINSSGRLNIPAFCNIEYGNGILLDGTISCATNSALITSIKYCQGGIWIYDGSPTIKHMRIMDCTSSPALTSTGSNTHVTIDHVRFQSTPSYGLYLCDGGDITMTKSDISGTMSDCIKITGLSSMLNLNNGHNDFHPNGNKAIANQSGIAISANQNYWGSSNPSGSDLFTYPTDVTWYPDYNQNEYNEAPAASKQAYIADIDPFLDAYLLEAQGDYTGALEQYYSIVDTDVNYINRKAAIKKIIHIHRNNNGDFSSVANLLEKQRNGAEGWYAANLDYMTAMIDVYRGNFDSAVKRLENIASEYRNTMFEAEAFARIAVIKGDHFLDKRSVVSYADKAAAINPRLPLLRLAYDTAEIDYEPEKYTDRFAEWDGTFQKPAAPEATDEAAETVTPTLSISPNPANPTTTIAYTLPNARNVSLIVYSISGQKVATLADGFMEAGSHSAVFDGAGLASGVYIYQFRTQGFNKTGKIMLVK